MLGGQAYVGAELRATRSGVGGPESEVGGSQGRLAAAKRDSLRPSRNGSQLWPGANSLASTG